MIGIWLLAVVGGFGLALAAGQNAVSHARVLAEASRIPPFFIGITLFAIGTDLPEMANSIAASVSGHGDLNVGDSLGSAATQVTLILGLMPLLAFAFRVTVDGVRGAGVASIVALLIGAWLYADGYLGRLDALILISMWLAGSFLIWRTLPPQSAPAMTMPARRPAAHAGWAVLMLAGVGAGAAVAVWGLINIAEEFALPEFALAFFGASVGTSLPELVVNVTALRREARDLALGGILGATFVDATLSIGIGPLIAPTVITASFAVRGAFAAAAVVAVVTVVLILRRRHDWITGVGFIGLWLALFYALLS